MFLFCERYIVIISNTSQLSLNYFLNMFLLTTLNITLILKSIDLVVESHGNIFLSSKAFNLLIRCQTVSMGNKATGEILSEKLLPLLLIILVKR